MKTKELYYLVVKACNFLEEEDIKLTVAGVIRTICYQNKGYIKKDLNNEAVKYMIKTYLNRQIKNGGLS